MAKTQLPMQGPKVSSLVGEPSSYTLQLKISHAATKTQPSQINKYISHTHTHTKKAGNVEGEKGVRFRAVFLRVTFREKWMKAELGKAELPSRRW